MSSFKSFLGYMGTSPSKAVESTIASGKEAVSDLLRSAEKRLFNIAAKFEIPPVVDDLTRDPRADTLKPLTVDDFEEFARHGRDFRSVMISHLLHSEGVQQRDIHAVIETFALCEETLLIERMAYCAHYVLKTAASRSRDGLDIMRSFSIDLEKALYLINRLDRDSIRSAESYARACMSSKASIHRRAETAPGADSREGSKSLIVSPASGDRVFDGLTILRSLQSSDGLGEIFQDDERDVDGYLAARPVCRPCVVDLEEARALLSGPSPDFSGFVESLPLRTGAYNSFSSWFYSLFRGSVENTSRSLSARSPISSGDIDAMCDELMRNSVMSFVLRSLKNRAFVYKTDVCMEMNEYSNVVPAFHGGAVFSAIIALTSLAPLMSLCGSIRSVMSLNILEGLTHLHSPSSEWAVGMERELGLREKDLPRGKGESLSIPCGSHIFLEDYELCKRWALRRVSHIVEDMVQVSATAEQARDAVLGYGSAESDEFVSNATTIKELADNFVFVSEYLKQMVDEKRGRYVSGLLRREWSNSNLFLLFIEYSSFVKMMSYLTGCSLKDSMEAFISWSTQLQFTSSSDPRLAAPTESTSTSMLLAYYSYSPAKDTVHWDYLPELDGLDRDQELADEMKNVLVRGRKIRAITTRRLPFSLLPEAVIRMIGSSLYMQMDALSKTEKMERGRFSPRTEDTEDPSYEIETRQADPHLVSGVQTTLRVRNALPSFPAQGYRHDRIKWEPVVHVLHKKLSFRVFSSAVVNIGEKSGALDILDRDGEFRIDGNLSVYSDELALMFKVRFFRSVSDSCTKFLVYPPTYPSGADVHEEGRIQFHEFELIYNYIRMFEIVLRRIESLVYLYNFSGNRGAGHEVKVVLSGLKDGPFDSVSAVLSKNGYVRHEPSESAARHPHIHAWALDLSSEGTLFGSKWVSRDPDFQITEKYIISQEGFPAIGHVVDDGSSSSSSSVESLYVWNQARAFEDNPDDLEVNMSDITGKFDIPPIDSFGPTGIIVDGHLLERDGLLASVIIDYEAPPFSASQRGGAPSILPTNSVMGFIVNVIDKQTPKLQIHVPLSDSSTIELRYYDINTTRGEVEFALGVIDHVMKNLGLDRVLHWESIRDGDPISRHLPVLDGYGWNAESSVRSKSYNKYASAPSRLGASSSREAPGIVDKLGKRFEVVSADKRSRLVILMNRVLLHDEDAHEE